MENVIVSVAGAPELSVRGLTGVERLGEDARFELSMFASSPVPWADLVGKACSITLQGPTASRVFLGTVTSSASVATSQAAPGRRYKLVVRASSHRLAYRRRTYVFRKLSVPDIIAEVFKDHAFDAAQIDVSPAGSLPVREYVVQYDETDAAFVRRLCEEEGLYLWHEVRDDKETFVLEGRSASAPSALVAKLPLHDGHALALSREIAFACTSTRSFRPGKVMVRGYDHEHPAAKLEGVAQGGADLERAFEVFRAPARITAPGTETARAKAILESHRAAAQVARFSTSSLSLVPGHAVEIVPAPGYQGLAKPEGKHLVVGLTHRYEKGAESYGLTVEALPLDVPFRLPMVTPRPRLHGVHSAVVTGAPGEEIHVDSLGRVRVHFPWDREGPVDDKSSLPVRVSQPNVPGSMMIPRVGWEVFVVFEDGDADRPVAMGRTYNGKEVPPVPLPANKTMTTLGTRSSPGGGKRNIWSMDDAAGRQHMLFDAGFAFTSTIANNLARTVHKNENHTVLGDQVWSVGAAQLVSAGDVIEVASDTQRTMVGGVQKLNVAGASKVSLSTEVVMVGGAVLEQVGDPVKGLKNLAIAAALSAPGVVSGFCSGLPELLLDKAGTLVKMGFAGYQYAQAQAAAGGKGDHGVSATSLVGGLAGGVADLIGIPGVEGLGQAADQIADANAEAAEAKEAEGEGTGTKGEAPPPPPGGGGAVAGGGAQAGGPKGGSAEAGGSGKRDTGVKGVMIELIGAAHHVATPGSLSWSGLAASAVVVGGSHVTRALKYGYSVGGPMKVKAGAVYITAKKEITRTVKGPVTTTIAGALSRDAEEDQMIKVEGAKLTLDVHGKLTIKGETVFESGSSKVVISSGGVSIKSSQVEYNGHVVYKAPATKK